MCLLLPLQCVCPNALPLRNVIAHIAQQMFVDADPKSLAPVPAGKTGP